MACLATLFPSASCPYRDGLNNLAYNSHFHPTTSHRYETANGADIHASPFLPRGSVHGPPSSQVHFGRSRKRHSVEISTKKPGSAIAAPTAIRLSEVVKGRISGGQDHFWRIEGPVGKYRIVFDAKNANDSAVGLIIGVKGSAGGDETSLVSLSDNQTRQRGAAEFGIPKAGVTLRVGGATAVVDYWLAVTPVDAEIAIPYFVKTPAVTPVEVGKPATARLSASEPEAWFSTSLEAKDYKVTAEFTRTDKASSMSASLSIFGSIGERMAGPAKVCSVTENMTTATCMSKLVVAQDGPVTLRVSADWKDNYKATFKLEPIRD